MATENRAWIARVAELEWVNYAATLVTAEVTPGLDVVLREDVIITTSGAFPTPDANHACLLRASPQAVDALIEEVIEHFVFRSLPTTVFISPACEPTSLPSRLLEQGFARQEEEAWLVLDLSGFDIPPLLPGAQVRPIDVDEVSTMARIFLVAFEMPTTFAPYLTQLLRPTLGLSTVHHYISLIDGQPVGTCSLLRYENYGILGSAGVLPDYRRSGVATNLVVKAVTDARDHGVDTVITQTAADTSLERLLRISGFKRVFTRVSYTLL